MGSLAKAKRAHKPRTSNFNIIAIFNCCSSPKVRNVLLSEDAAEFIHKSCLLQSFLLENTGE